MSDTTLKQEPVYSMKGTQKKCTAPSDSLISVHYRIKMFQLSYVLEVQMTLKATTTVFAIQTF